MTPNSTRQGYDPRVTVVGDGPPLVLVPGLDGTGALFYRQTPALARSHRVATYALRDDARTMDALVEDLDAVVEALAPDGQPAVVVGESFGGALAMSFALARPDRVSGLVVLNSFAHYRGQAWLRLGILGLQVMPWGSMGLVRRLTAFRLHSRHTPGDEVRQFMTHTSQARREGYLGRLRLLTEYDLRPRLAAIQTPTLFLAATEDHLVPAVAQATFMAARVPGAALHLLDGHGHICLIAPDLHLDELIRQWRAGLLPPYTPPRAPAPPVAPEAARTRP